MAVTLPAGFTQTLVASGFNEPTDMVPGPSGQFFITEKTGALRVFDKGILQPTPFVTLAVDTLNDRGLDAVLLDPHFSTNGYVYLYYTTAVPSNPNAEFNGAVCRLSRFTADPKNPNVALAGSEKILIDNIPSNTGNHIGGLLTFGNEGKIYLGTGNGNYDFNAQTDGTPNYAQDLTNLGGKILRINSDGTIPSDNPFVGVAGDQPAIWAYGMRNPFSGGVDPSTGKLIVNDVGQELWEEVDVITKGGNYGWPNAEGKSSSSGSINPLYTYAHDPTQVFSAAVAGGAFYHGATFPSSFAGKYFFADVVQGWIATLDPATGIPSPFATGTSGPIRIENSSDGGIFYLAHDALAIYKISYSGPNIAELPFGGTPAAVPGTIQTAKYDTGGEGLAYHDTTSANLGNANYRPADGVDLEISSDPGSAYNVGHWVAGEWTTYTVNVATYGPYQFTARVASLGNGGTFHLNVDGVNVTGAITIPNTGGWQTYHSISVPNVALTPGPHVIQLMGDTNGASGSVGNVASLTFAPPTAGVLPSVTIAPNTNADEPSAAPGAFTVTRTGSTSQVLTVHLTSGGTAINGSDYVPLGLTLDIPPGSASSTITVKPISDTSSDGTKTAVITLAANSAYTVARASATLSITDAGAAAASTPYSGTPAALPGTIQTANFDNGGEGVAYHMLTSTDQGSANPRPGTAVSLDNCSDPGSAYNLSWFYAGEWLNYTVSVAASGTYPLQIRVASSGNGGSIHLNVDGADVTSSLTIPNTGGWQTYQTITVPNVTLGAGQHVIRIVGDFNGTQGFVGNIASLTFGTTSTALPGVSIAATAPTADEQTAAAGSFTVTRTGSTAAALTISLTIGGTAVNGTDYTAIASSLIIPAGAASATIAVKPIADIVIDGTKTVLVSIASNSAYTITTASATVSITDAAASAGSTPFFGTPMTVPGTIMVANFDNGGQNVAFYETTPGNQGGAYRTTDVDIESSTDITPPGLTTTSPGVGFDIGHIVAGEWLQYTISATAGTYPVSLRVANAGSTGSFHLSVDGNNVSGAVAFPVTGGWQTWQTISVGTVSFTAGQHVLRLSFDSSAAHEMGNVEWLQLGTAVAPVFSWKSIAPAPLPRDEGGIAVVNAKLYAFSGFDSNSYTADARADVYDPATNVWTRLADMPEPITHGQTIVDGNTIWMIGGFIGPEVDGGTSQVWKYNTVTNTYSAGPSLPSALGAGAVVLFGRNIHVISGLTAVNGTFLNTTEHWVLNLDNQSAGWTNAAPIPRPRNHDAAVVFNNQIWVIGGQNAKNEYTGNSAAVDVYDPATNTWSAPGDLPVGRSHIANSVMIFKNTIYIFGGETNNATPMGDVLAWNSASKIWESQPAYTMPQPRKAPNVAIVGKYMVAFGGADPGPLADGWSALL